MGTSLVAQSVKSLTAMQESSGSIPGWEDPLEKEMTTHSSILAWRIPWSEKPGRLQYLGLHRIRHDLATTPPQLEMVSKLAMKNSDFSEFYELV